MPKRQVVWGFPGAGGGYRDLHTLQGGFMKTVFLQTEETAASAARYRQVAGLFEHAGFSITRQKQMRDWLWGHYIMNVAMAAVAMKAGGHRKAFQSTVSVEEMVRLMRELAPLIREKGGRPDRMTALLVLLPVKLIAPVLKNASAPGTLAGEIMDRMEQSGHASPGLSYDYIREIIDAMPTYDAKLPVLMGYQKH